MNAVGIKEMTQDGFVATEIVLKASLTLHPFALSKKVALIFELCFGLTATHGLPTNLLVDDIFGLWVHRKWLFNLVAFAIFSGCHKTVLRHFFDANCIHCLNVILQVHEKVLCLAFITWKFIRCLLVAKLDGHLFRGILATKHLLNACLEISHCGRCEFCVIWIVLRHRKILFELLIKLCRPGLYEGMQVTNASVFDERRLSIRLAMPRRICVVNRFSGHHIFFDLLTKCVSDQGPFLLGNKSLGVLDRATWQDCEQRGYRVYVWEIILIREHKPISMFCKSFVLRHPRTLCVHTPHGTKQADLPATS